MNRRLLSLIPICSALTAAGAFIKIPIAPVPITLQNFFVILSGIILGPKAGALSQIVYIIIGLIGLPVFSGGGGPSYIFKPTFGYILG
ncbi:MAG TPA: biotin transporter BioY, partial [Deltaproteobacteria bacterium]|nr:biotin transporter BioY [Deltaproteobacteria bacterium]